MRNLLKLSLFFILVFATACAPRFGRLLPSPCSAPCWYNVTPGETSKSELIKEVSTFPYYQEENVNWRDENEAYSKNVPGSSSGAFEMFIDDRWASVSIRFKDNLVSDVGFYSGLDFFEQHIKLGPTLVDIIDSYGKPDNMFVSKGCGGDVICRNLVLVYPDRGILVAVESGDGPDNFRVERTLPVVSMIYFQPPDYQSSLSSLPNICSKYYSPVAYMLPWQGFTAVHFAFEYGSC